MGKYQNYRNVQLVGLVFLIGLIMVNAKDAFVVDETVIHPSAVFLAGWAVLSLGLLILSTLRDAWDGELFWEEEGE